MIRTFEELKNIKTFEERFNYLKLPNIVGEETFGFDRYLNQMFYRSKEWKQIRDYVIARDNGCNLGIDDRPIFGKILVHHMNPILKNDIVVSSDLLLDPNYLICVDHKTHNLIHYGIDNDEFKFVERFPNDTCPWKEVEM